jgi:chromosome segregation ATPase
LTKSFFFVLIACFLAFCTTETQKEASKLVARMQDETKAQSNCLKETDPRVVILQQRVDALKVHFTTKNDTAFDGILEALVTADNYVSEFEKELQEITDEIAFTKKQLANLKDDIKSNIHSEEMLSKYLFDEQMSIEQTQEKINYLVLRLETQEFLVENLKNRYHVDLP